MPSISCTKLSNSVVVVFAIATVFACEGSIARGATLSGIVQSGGDVYTVPLTSVTVTLYEATSLQPVAIQHTTTDRSGKFTMTTQSSVSKTIFYLVADLGNPVQLVVILGPTLPMSVTINELTTVAASYSMAQFFHAGVISGNPNDLKTAATMNGNFVAIATGKPASALLSSKNAGNIHSLSTLRSLANVLGICNFNRGIAAYFLELTKPPGGTLPASTPQAMANLARSPGQNVVSIYYLTYMWFTYSPGLNVVPNTWAIIVKPNA